MIDDIAIIKPKPIAYSMSNGGSLIEENGQVGNMESLSSSAAYQPNVVLEMSLFSVIQNFQSLAVNIYQPKPEDHINKVIVWVVWL